MKNKCGGVDMKIKWWGVDMKIKWWYVSLIGTEIGSLVVPTPME